MKFCLMLLSLALSAGSCLPPQTVTQIVATDIPDELTDELTVKPRAVRNLEDIGLVLADHVEVVDKANVDRAAVRCIEDAWKAATETPDEQTLNGCTSQTERP